MRIEGLVQEVFTVDESNAIWGHPILDLFEPPASSVPQRARLYSVPSLFGEIYENDDAPQPTSASELPGLHRWIARLRCGRDVDSQLNSCNAVIG
jgi:hypothetical protein